MIKIKAINKLEIDFFLMIFSVFLYAIYNVFLFLHMSIVIQIGRAIIITLTKKPNGLISKALEKSPLIIDKTDLVDPQDGHGKPVVFLIKHI